MRKVVLLLVLALIVEYLVIPELVGASKDLYLLGQVGVLWAIAAVALEGASLFCYALLTRALLPAEGRPGLGGLFAIDLSAAAVAHVIPAGTIGSAGVGYQLFTSEGLDGTDVGIMMATKGMGSTVVLNVLLWVALVISIPVSGFRPLYGTVAIVGAVLLAAFAAVVIGFTRGGARAARILRAVGVSSCPALPCIWSSSPARSTDSSASSAGSKTSFLGRVRREQPGDLLGLLSQAAVPSG